MAIAHGKDDHGGLPGELAQLLTALVAAAPLASPSDPLAWYIIAVIVVVVVVTPGTKWAAWPWTSPRRIE
ncbi:hypothetical protein ACFV0C_22665 [Streptomyces sp. NPDC059568]|uniref:hypothetical protein n=1 Tax=Streptomyces sp. NPDC059568 TaxID=3346868 RepID=UPI00369643C5